MPQRLGQHFLKNKAVVQKIIAALDLKSGETIVEIGSGKGALTLPLARACAGAGCNIIAIEKDAELAGGLMGLKIDKLEVVHGDALKELPRLTSDIGHRTSNVKLVGNIPYYITGHLLRAIGELEHKPSRTVLMIQKEVAERLTAKPGNMNLLAAAVQVWAEVSIVDQLKPEDFDPPPKVDSAVVKLETDNLKLETEEVKRYYAFIRAAFKQPRKTLLNNLVDGLGMSKGEIMETLSRLGYTEKTRAQELGIGALIKLAAQFPLRTSK